MFTQWVIVLLRLMAVELTGSSGNASVYVSREHHAGTDQMVCFGLGGGEGELSCDLSSPVCGDTGKNNWKHSSLSTAQKMKHSVYLPVFA